ncbi:MAG TPA: GFA family protein [Candidatus Binataceae bacterium]|nr:GFA family protein [Candidatus Binataceae bacterium]
MEAQQAARAKYRGGCHCGRVAYEVDGPIERVSECNCSICSKKAYLHWIVPRDRFRLLTPWEDLATYTFNTHTAKHHFCPRCGVASFYIARSDPDKIDVNLRCVDGVDLAVFPTAHFDGRNWEAAQAAFVAGQKPG